MKEEGPRAVCTGCENEMITPGGEVAFVKKILNESVELERRTSQKCEDGQASRYR
jgi:hypothetical protein